MTTYKQASHRLRLLSALQAIILPATAGSVDPASVLQDLAVLTVQQAEEVLVEWKLFMPETLAICQQHGV